MFKDVRTLRIALLVVASWIVVAATSGYAVYRIVKPGAVRATAPDEQSHGEERPVPRDPAGADADEMLAAHDEQRSRQRAMSGTGIMSDPDDPDVDSSAVPSASGAAAESSRASRLAREQERQRAVFQEVLAGRKSWSAVDHAMMAALKVDDIQLGLQQVAAMPWTPEASRLLQGLVRRWAEVDPAAAATYALGLEGNRAASQAIRSVWGVWARADPGAASDWYFAQLGENPARLAGTLSDAFSTLASIDMARALATAWQLPEAQGREALKAIVRRASLEGGLGALEPIIAGMSPGYQRSQMIQAIVQEYAVYQPELAVHWINQIDNPSTRADAIDQFAGIWAFDRPADAAGWVMGIQDPTLRARSAASVIRHWSLSDPEAAGNWLLQIPPSKPMDGVLERHIRINLEENPAYAAQFLSRIVDQRRRDALSVTIGRTWMRRNPGEAQAFLQQSGWSAAVQQRILNP